ncbi:MAG: hypothetical protein LBK66_05160 [Spirochaetaceae bacterium]|jgi:hypothetical protein|nr:hypothetical protein [Spirochaetaceae bacterium]
MNRLTGDFLPCKLIEQSFAEAQVRRSSGLRQPINRGFAANSRVNSKTCKRVRLLTGVFAALLFFLALPAFPADDNLIDSDFEDLFSETEESVEPSENSSAGKQYSRLQDFIMSTGFGIDTSYQIIGGYMPGWNEAPWYFENPEASVAKLENLIGAKMSATIGLDIQPSRYLLIRQSFSFAIPSPPLSIKEFFFDYNFMDKFFLKAGKFDAVWGVSPNFPFANLIARIPLDVENPGDPYLAKLSIPVNIGGFELIMLTRPGYIDLQNPHLENFGEGFKYNLALQKLDMDIGFFYFERIPFRCFISLKTTLFKNIEFYTEAMGNVVSATWEDFGISGSMGFVTDFFDKKIKLNAEIYYNGEGDAASLRRNNLLVDEPEDFRLFKGFNSAFNISFIPGGIERIHVILGYLHAFEKNSAQIVPAISFEPAEHIELYFGVPMAAGSRDEDSYYRHNADTNNRPFSIVVAVKINGSYKYGHFE